MATEPPPFLRLPLELREAIYSLYFKAADRLVQNHALEADGFCGGVYKFEFDLLRVNRQIYREASTVWRRDNVFVKIATPWPSAGMYRVYLMATDDRDTPHYDADGRLNHISSEGLVPIVCAEPHSDQFTTHHALVQITAPFHQAVPEHTIVVHINDVHLFAQTWFYSALSYPMLNDRLSTTFVLRNPNLHDTSLTQEVSLPLQRRLLLPFEQVKGLYHKEISGYAPSVKAELERRMAIPIPTLVACCEKATDLMVQGDRLLAADKAAESLDVYNQAFRAIHILIHGRTRRVLGDIFFHEAITSGRYTGQTGSTVRVILRVKLVARVLLAHLKLQEYGEAAFWGMRTVRIMRDAMDTEFEDFINEIVGWDDVGMIYVRTGLAFWKMETDYRDHGEKSRWRAELARYEGDYLSGSERSWKSASRFLRIRDKASVRKEMEQFGAPQAAIEPLRDEEVSVENVSTVATDGSSE